jgi:hypothetical protein
VGDPWLSITLTLCHILLSVSHWPVLVYFINKAQAMLPHMMKYYCSLAGLQNRSNLSQATKRAQA